MTTSTPTLVNQTQFAALIGKHKSYVTNLKKAERLVMTAEGLVDVEKSKAMIAATSDPSRNAAVEARANETMHGEQRAAPAPDGISNSYQIARGVNEKYKALTAKAEYEQLIGKLVDADEARLFAADLAASFRGALEILPDRLSPELVPLKETEAVRAVLVESFEQVLNDLADKIRRWGVSDAEAARILEMENIKANRAGASEYIFTEARQAAVERAAQANRDKFIKRQREKEEVDIARIEQEKKLSDAQRVELEHAREELRKQEEVLRQREKQFGLATKIEIQSHSVIDDFELPRLTKEKREEDKKSRGVEE